MLGMLHDIAATALRTTTTGLTAGTPSGPRRDIAVDWARPISATLRPAEHRASNSAEGNRGLNRAATGLGASGAGDGARGPGSPRRDNAVNGASLGVAPLHLSEDWAFLASMCDTDANSTGTSLGATAAGQAAS